MNQCNVYKESIQNEANVHRSLKHKHIVEFIEKFEDEKYVYMVQSLCSNQSLEDLRKKRGFSTIAECRYFIYQTLQGIQYIHDKGIIHRDLKLSNILLDENMQVRICDFGFAIHVDKAKSSRTICGTKSYIAPEIGRRQGSKCCSDIWSIGVIAFVLFLGSYPFTDTYSFDDFEDIVRSKCRWQFFGFSFVCLQ